jgi:hypothetical protein
MTNSTRLFLVNQINRYAQNFKIPVIDHIDQKFTSDIIHITDLGLTFAVIAFTSSNRHTLDGLLYIRRVSDFHIFNKAKASRFFLKLCSDITYV